MPPRTAGSRTGPATDEVVFYTLVNNPEPELPFQNTYNKNYSV